MPTVRLSGKLQGATDARRKERAEILYHLFLNGWDIYNGNGDQTVHLENIQKKIIESDSFVFTQDPSIEDYFNFASVFVGFQTFDGDLKDKPAVIVNGNKSWDSFLSLMEHLHNLGTLKQKYTDFVKVVENSAELLSYLNSKVVEGRYCEVKEPDFLETGIVYRENEKIIPAPDYSVCVFCSASINKKPYLDDGYNLGKALAEKGFGCISGAGKTGIMGQVVTGAYENGGWSAGSNIPHIIELEGLPDGLNEFWPRADIYTRMLVMIERSQSFVIMPGGLGTVQELLALLHLKFEDHYLMKDKKITIFNRIDEQTGLKFWQPIIDIIKLHAGKIPGIQVVSTFDELVEKL